MTSTMNNVDYITIEPLLTRFALLSTFAGGDAS